MITKSMYSISYPKEVEVISRLEPPKNEVATFATIQDNSTPTSHNRKTP